MNLTDYTEIKALLARHRFRFSKSMGQNFLTAAWVPEDIADSAELDGETGVLEIGPGIGCLTRELARRAGKVVSVELDRSLQPILAETLTGCENVEVVFGDVLRQDLPALLEETMPGLRHVVCANLPYNVTSPVLTALIRSGCFETIAVMIQREVARRICAGPGNADYGAFGIFVQWYMDTEILFDVPPSCFVPQPKVTSSVIRLKKREVPPAEVQDEELMFRLIRAAFNQRRKTLVNAAGSQVPGVSRETMENVLRSLGYDPRIRGEVLDIGGFAKIADKIIGMRDVDYVVDGDGTWRYLDAVQSNFDTFRGTTLIEGGSAEQPGISTGEFERLMSGSAMVTNILDQQRDFRQYVVMPFPYYTLTKEQSDAIAPLQKELGYYVDMQIARWVLGEEEISDESFAAFEEKLNELGLNEFLSFWQDVLNRM